MVCQRMMLMFALQASTREDVVDELLMGAYPVENILFQCNSKHIPVDLIFTPVDIKW